MWKIYDPEPLEYIQWEEEILIKLTSTPVWNKRFRALTLRLNTKGRARKLIESLPKEAKQDPRKIIQALNNKFVQEKTFLQEIIKADDYFTDDFLFDTLYLLIDEDKPY